MSSSDLNENDPDALSDRAKALKVVIVEEFKVKMNQKPCKYFKRNGSCPFGSCGVYKLCIYIY